MGQNSDVIWHEYKLVTLQQINMFRPTKKKKPNTTKMKPKRFAGGQDQQMRTCPLWYTWSISSKSAPLLRIISPIQRAICRYLPGYSNQERCVFLSKYFPTQDSSCIIVEGHLQLDAGLTGFMWLLDHQSLPEENSDWFLTNGA